VKFARSKWLILMSKWTEASGTNSGIHFKCKAPVCFGVLAGYRQQQKWEITLEVWNSTKSLFSIKQTADCHSTKHKSNNCHLIEKRSLAELGVF